MLLSYLKDILYLLGRVKLLFLVLSFDFTDYIVEVVG